MATTDRYENAAKSYQDAMNKYSGEAGWNLAKKQGKEYQDIATEGARATNYKTARNAGYGKALSNKLGAQAGKETAVSSLGQGTSTALTNNSNAINAASQNYQTQADTAKNVYNQRMGITSGVTGTVGSFLSALSDERVKDEIKPENQDDKVQS